MKAIFYGPCVRRHPGTPSRTGAVCTSPGRAPPHQCAGVPSHVHQHMAHHPAPHTPPHPTPGRLGPALPGRQHQCPRLDSPCLQVAPTRHSIYCPRVCRPTHLSLSCRIYYHFRTHTGCEERGGGYPFPSPPIPILDLRASRMPGAPSPPGLPHPWSSAIAPTLNRIRSTDRGSVRARNVGTAISRAHHFVAWAASNGW